MLEKADNEIMRICNDIEDILLHSTLTQEERTRLLNISSDLLDLSIDIYEHTEQDIVEEMSEEDIDSTGNMPCDNTGYCAGASCSKFFECNA